LKLVWDFLAEQGRPFDLHAAGMLALDVARIEAGLILIDVDYVSSKRALIASQKYSPFEIGLERLVDLNKEYFIGRDALEKEKQSGPKRLLTGLEINWDDVERLFDAVGLAPQVPETASRVAVPVYGGGSQVGKATSTTWSPSLKKMIALASIRSDHAALGTEVEMEFTVEAVRHKVRATSRALPFFRPLRKTATPV
jgi:aminomethyltransferase